MGAWVEDHSPRSPTGWMGPKVRTLLVRIPRCDHYFEMGRLAATLILILYASSVFAGFRTYSQWRAMSLEARTAYIAGAIDSLLFSNPEARQHYGDCISNAKIPAAQLALSLAAFIDARPNLQGGAVQNGLIEYLIALCDQQPGAPGVAVKPD